MSDKDIVLDALIQLIGSFVLSDAILSADLLLVIDAHVESADFTAVSRINFLWKQALPGALLEDLDDPIADELPVVLFTVLVDNLVQVFLKLVGFFATGVEHGIHPAPVLAAHFANALALHQLALVAGAVVLWDSGSHF